LLALSQRVLSVLTALSQLPESALAEVMAFFEEVDKAGRIDAGAEVCRGVFVALSVRVLSDYTAP
jgi:hypothetical protein